MRFKMVEYSFLLKVFAKNLFIEPFLMSFLINQKLADFFYSRINFFFNKKKKILRLRSLISK